MSIDIHHSEQRRADNGNDHRAGTSDLNTEKHAHVRLRVHRIVIPQLLGSSFEMSRVEIDVVCVNLTTGYVFSWNFRGLLLPVGYTREFLHFNNLFISSNKSSNEKLR
jgi:hypothetical protein